MKVILKSATGHATKSKNMFPFTEVLAADGSFANEKFADHR